LRREGLEFGEHLFHVLGGLGKELLQMDFPLFTFSQLGDADLEDPLKFIHFSSHLYKIVLLEEGHKVQGIVPDASFHFARSVGQLKRQVRVTGLRPGHSLFFDQKDALYRLALFHFVDECLSHISSLKKVRGQG